MPPGERNSGMPDSVDMPAPVKITARRLSRSKAASAVTGINESLAPLPLRPSMRHRPGRGDGLDVAAIGFHPVALVAGADLVGLAVHGALEIVASAVMLVAGPVDLRMAHAFHRPVTHHFGGHGRCG